MDKRYQVFISSTFTDLAKERESLMQTLMKLDCIPAGMELFPAADEEQWAFIEKIIDDCDYYLLIIGGRYGSTDAEGLSYTEKEFDYAVDKGIHVIALLHKTPDELPMAKSETDKKARRKLADFRQKVQTGRLVTFWTSPQELLHAAVLSLTQAFKAHPRSGWVRGGSTSNQVLLEQINDLRQQKEELEKRLAERDNDSILPASFRLASTDATIPVTVKWQRKPNGFGGSIDETSSDKVSKRHAEHLYPVAS